MSNNIELRKFVAPEIITGEDARLLIDRYMTHFSARKPMIVTDPQVRALDWFQEIVSKLSVVVPEYIIYDEVTVNPKDIEAMRGAEIFLANACDLIIAIGGGSPMDCAKCISIVSTNGGHILDYEGVDEITLPGPPLICIPSTAGTSADVSQFAIINDTDMNIKKAIISKKVVPDLALIDPIPLMTMDYYLTACTGMDALTHAIEAYVSNANSPLTDVHALEAIRLVSNHLTSVCIEDRSLNDMYEMMTASLCAGLAFSNASLGAVHAMAHSLGGLLDLPHGECNSILLEHIIELNYSDAEDRYNKIADVFGVDLKTSKNIKQDLIIKISHLRQQINIPENVVLDKITPALLDKLTNAALNDPCMVTNPRETTFEEIRCIYERILKTK